MRRISLLLMFVLATLVAAGCGEFGERFSGDDKSSTKAAAGKESVVSKDPFDAAARAKDGCTEVEEFESEGSEHTTDPKEKVEYEANPPHSGSHYQVPVDWGLYDTQQADVSTTHNLEHGHIVISFKGLTDKQKDTLYDHARLNPFHLVVQPREKNPKDGVYYGAWTAQIYCKTPSAAALQYMIDNWRDQGPELFTTDPGGDEQMGSKQKDS